MPSPTLGRSAPHGAAAKTFVGVSSFAEGSGEEEVVDAPQSILCNHERKRTRSEAI